MRNVQVVCAGAAVLAAAMLTGCNKEPEAKKPMDDTPIIVSDSGGKPGGLAGTPTSLSNSKAAFSSWPNNGSSGKGVTQIYPPFTTFTNVTVAAGTNPPVTYCAGAKQCNVECWLDGTGSNKISFQYVAASEHPFSLASSATNFNDFTNWAAGLQITDPQADSSIKKIKAGSDMIDCSSTTCQVTINAK
jgi:hypothetical protein